MRWQRVWGCETNGCRLNRAAIILLNSRELWLLHTTGAITISSRMGGRPYKVPPDLEGLLATLLQGRVSLSSVV